MKTILLILSLLSFSILNAQYNAVSKRQGIYNEKDSSYNINEKITHLGFKFHFQDFTATSVSIMRFEEGRTKYYFYKIDSIVTVLENSPNLNKVYASSLDDKVIVMYDNWNYFHFCYDYNPTIVAKGGKLRGVYTKFYNGTFKIEQDEGK